MHRVNISYHEYASNLYPSGIL